MTIAMIILFALLAGYTLARGIRRYQLGGFRFYLVGPGYIRLPFSCWPWR